MAMRLNVLRNLPKFQFGRQFSSLNHGRDVFVHDVTPRDGIQNEKTILDVDAKVELIRRLISARPSSVEIASFVRGDLVPAMAGAAEVCEVLSTKDWMKTAKAEGMEFMGLVPNMKGYENFRKASLQEKMKVIDTVVCLVSCTESHSQANVRMPLQKALDTTLSVVSQAKKDGFYVRAYCSLAFCCPFEGAVDPQIVKDIASAYVEGGADRVILADTLGKATTKNVGDLLPLIMEVLPAEKIGLHMHNAHGKAQENIKLACELGVRHFDSSLGGAGGCNFVPDAKGNISTQALLGVFDHLGLVHGMDTHALDEANIYLQDALHRPLENSYAFAI